MARFRDVPCLSLLQKIKTGIFAQADVPFLFFGCAILPKFGRRCENIPLRTVKNYAVRGARTIFIAQNQNTMPNA